MKNIKHYLKSPNWILFFILTICASDVSKIESGSIVGDGAAVAAALFLLVTFYEICRNIYRLIRTRAKPPLFQIIFNTSLFVLLYYIFMKIEEFKPLR